MAKDKIISIFLEGRWIALDRDKLTDAYLEFLDAPSMDEVSNILLDRGWDVSDALLYASAASVCMVAGVEP